MKKPGVVGCLAISGILFAGFRAAQGPFHLGAPPLPYTCPPGHTVVTHWEKGTALAGQPGTLVWHGWTEWASCSQSMTIDGG